MRPLAVISLLLILTVTAFAAPVALSATSTPTTSLKVSSVLQSVPADGQTHGAIVLSLVDQSNKPYIPTSSLDVLLSSSSIGTGTVPGSVSFPAGAQFVIVNFTSTTTPGSTQISASSQGVKPSSLQLRTAALGGVPAEMQVSAAPSRVVPQPYNGGTILVELVDGRGNPAQSANDTVVTLSSSNPAVVALTNETVVIPAGESLVSTSYTSGLVTGTAQISFSSPGLKGGTTTVTVTGPTPTQLKGELASNPLAPNSNGTLVVWLAGSSGDPTLAPSDVTLSVFSSNSSVVTVAGSATISAGEYYTDIEYDSLALGANVTQASATLTVSSTGLTSVSVPVEVHNASSPVSLVLSLAPPTVLANGGSEEAVFVSISGSSGPAAAVSEVEVSLFSSNPSVLNVSDTVTIQPGQYSAGATVYTGYAAGSSQITASATDLRSDMVEMYTYSQTPSSLSAAQTLSSVPADGGTYYALDIGLQSSGGLPADAPSDTLLNVFSSNPSVAAVNDTVTIPQGNSSVLLPVFTTTSPGKTTITVSASGLGTSTATVTTVVPGASELGLTVSPQPALSVSGYSAGVAAVQLLDASGDPVQTQVPVNVTIVATDKAVLPSSVMVTVPAGEDYVTFPLQVLAAGSTLLTATSASLRPSSLQVQFLAASLSAMIVAAASPATTNKTDVLSVYVTFQGQPLVGASVKWFTTLGSLAPQTGVTNSNGTAKTGLKAAAAGEATVGVEVTWSGIGPARATYSLDVASASSATLTSEWVIAAVGGAGAAIVAAAVVLYLRRRGADTGRLLLRYFEPD